jgi:hypothetical protein
MSARLLPVILLVLGLLLAPAAMAAEGRWPMAPAPMAASDHSSHCRDDSPARSNDESRHVRACALACAALLPVYPPAFSGGSPLRMSVAAIDPPILKGVAIDAETPPPRSAPSI